MYVSAHQAVHVTLCTGFGTIEYIARDESRLGSLKLDGVTAPAAYTVESFVEEVLSHRRQHVFLSGPAGYGKTKIVNDFLVPALKRCYGKKAVMVVASTGMAANAICGDTIHSACGVGRGRGTAAEVVDKLSDDVVKRIQSCQVMLIDEISMIAAHLLDLVDEVFRHVKQKPKEVYGGVQLIPIGDFGQLPPVPDVYVDPVTGHKHAVPVKYAFEARSWGEAKLKCFQLSHCWRYVYSMHGAHDGPHEELLNTGLLHPALDYFVRLAR